MIALRGRKERTRVTEESENKRTLGDILEALVGSHDCDEELAINSRSKPGLNLEI